MNAINVTTIKILIAVLLATLVALQCLIAWNALTLALTDTYDSYTLGRQASVLATAFEAARAAIPAILSLAFTACVQLVLVCVWRLVTLAQAGKIFRVSAFTWVNIALGSVLTATGIVIAAVVIRLLFDHTTDRAFVLPGAVIALFGLGLALIITVMRSLLQQATQLEAELAEVI